MDWKLCGATFITVFFAELGDKTQLATLSFASSSESKLSVFIGSASALVATSAIAVIAATAISRFVSPLVLQRLAGAAFVLIGAWTLYSTFRAAA